MGKPFFWTKRNQDALIIKFKADAEELSIKLYNSYDCEIELDECFGISYLALVEAARTFRPLDGLFWAYAHKCILNAFRDYYRVMQRNYTLTHPD